jgi:hypothetical protein
LCEKAPAPQKCPGRVRAPAPQKHPGSKKRTSEGGRYKGEEHQQECLWHRRGNFIHKIPTRNTGVWGTRPMAQERPPLFLRQDKQTAGPTKMKSDGRSTCGLDFLSA